MKTHPDFLDHVSASISTMEDLKTISAVNAEKKELQKVIEAATAALQLAQKTAAKREVRQANLVAPVDQDPYRKLDCTICGKDVVITGYVAHLRDCINRNEEFSHSSADPNPSLCNEFSKRSERYCSMAKGSCPFHKKKAQLDGQYLICGFVERPGKVPCTAGAVQCAKHADWREVIVKSAQLRLTSLKGQRAALDSRIGNAKQRIARREMNREEQSK
jgi:hypothetical protein